MKAEINVKDGLGVIREIKDVASLSSMTDMIFINKAEDHLIFGVLEKFQEKEYRKVNLTEMNIQFYD